LLPRAPLPGAVLHVLLDERGCPRRADVRDALAVVHVLVESRRPAAGDLDGALADELLPVLGDGLALAAVDVHDPRVALDTPPDGLVLPGERLEHVRIVG